VTSNRNADACSLQVSLEVEIIVLVLLPMITIVCSGQIGYVLRAQSLVNLIFHEERSHVWYFFRNANLMVQLWTLSQNGSANVT
jgi:hypothetical protein